MKNTLTFSSFLLLSFRCISNPIYFFLIHRTSGFRKDTQGGAKKKILKEKHSWIIGFIINFYYFMESWDALPDRKVFLYLSYESHGGVGASVHSSQDCYDDKKPGGRASRIHPCYHIVLLMWGKRHVFSLQSAYWRAHPHTDESVMIKLRQYIHSCCVHWYLFQLSELHLVYWQTLTSFPQQINSNLIVNLSIFYQHLM